MPQVRRINDALCLVLFIAGVGLVAAQTPTSARFVSGVTGNVGIVEVTMSDGTVGRICDLGFDVNGSSAVCSMMGYRDVTGYTGYKVAGLPAVTTGSTTFVMAVIGCPNFLVNSPTTWNLATACTYMVGSFVPATCNSRSKDVGVVCTGSMTSTVAASVATVTPNMVTLPPTYCNSSVTDLRLNPGPDEGIVLIKNGTTGATNFGTICGLNFGANEATTICRMLCQNVTTNAIGTTGKYLSVAAAYPVMLSGLTCPSTATSTNACTHNGWSVAANGCNSSMAVTVRCIPIVQTPPDAPRASVICQANSATVFFPIADVGNSSLLSLFGTYNATTCSFTKGDNATTSWVSIPYTGCNTVQSTNATHIIYTSYLLKSVAPVGGVYMDSPYVIPVICVIPKLGAITAAILPDFRTVTPITGGDTYSSEVRLFQTYSTGTFQTEISAGQKLTVGSKIYARVMLTSALQLQLSVRSCWISDEKYGNGSTYYLVQNKCASTGNTVFRVDTKTVGISFTVVSFSASLTTQVYVFCDVIVCTERDTDPRCQQVCGTPYRRRKRSVEDAGTGIGQAHNGPFQIVQAAYLGFAGTSPAARPGSQGVVGLTATALAAAVVLKDSGTFGCWD